MTREEIRLQCAELAMPDGIANPDMDMVIAKAKRLFDFVVEDTGETRPRRTTTHAASKPGQAV